MGKTQDEISLKNNLFSHFKNKFIYIVLLIIFFIIWFWIYNSSFSAIDRNSYAILVNWNWIINTKPLKIDVKNKIKIWDTIRTLWEKSLLILEWWDWSVTRLWWNSTIKINELYLTDNLDKINISFKLLSWKSWSTVISFLWQWSYFHEEFRESVAAVRGTIFNIDLDSNYLNVIDHKVYLNKNNSKKIVITEDKPIDLKTFKFISLEEFITKFKDKTWEELNTKIDKQLFINLRNNLEKNIKDIVDIDNLDLNNLVNNPVKKEKIYNKILADYQKLNFVQPNNEELFNKKLELKDALIKLSSEQNKVDLIENSIYDLNNIIKSKKYDYLDKIIPIFYENKDVLNNINLNNINFDKLPNKIQDKFINFKYFLINNGMWNNIKQQIDKLNIWDTLNSIDKKIKNQLDTVKDTLITK